MNLPFEAVAMLQSDQLRVRTAIWLLPAVDWGTLADLCARMAIQLSDIRTPLLATVQPQQRFLGLDVNRILQALDALCQTTAFSSCIVVGHWDLVLARLDYRARQELWQSVYAGFPHRPRGVILPMPQTAQQLLPDPHRLEQWRVDDRLIE